MKISIDRKVIKTIEKKKTLNKKGKIGKEIINKQ